MQKKSLLDTVMLDEAPSKGFHMTHRHEMIAIFLIFLVFFGISTKNAGGSWNDQSRFATMEALVENPPNIPKFAIDNTTYGWWTGDKIYDGKHIYSTKPPVLSVIGAGIYYILHDWFDLDYTNQQQERIIYHFITWLLMGVPMSAMLALFYDLMRRLGLIKRHSIFLTLSLGLGSLFLPYTTVFNNHTFAGEAVFAGFYFLSKAVDHRGSRGWNLLISGLFSGLAVTVDIVGALPFAMAFLIYTLMIGLNRGWYKPVNLGLLMWGPFAVIALMVRFFVNRKVRWASIELWGNFLLGFTVFILIHLFFNIQITGGLKPVYSMQSLYSNLAVEGYYGEVIGQKEGLFSEARFRYVINSLFGLRGLFLYTPLIIFSLYFMIRVALDRRNRLARLSFLILIFLIPSWIYLLFETKNYGGTSYASRYFIAPMPMLFYFNAYLYRYATSEKLKGWFYEAFRMSVLMAVVGLAFPWGVIGELPQTNFSFFNNLQYWSQNILIVISQLSK